MSATTATAARQLPRRPGAPAEPLALRMLEVIGIVPVVAYLSWALSADWADFVSLLPSVIAWLLLVAVADLMPIPIWRSVQIAISLPVLLAAAFVFPTPVACFLAFAGPVDTREIRREIGLLRGLFNRANIAASVLVASVVFRSLKGDLTDWPMVLIAVFAALVADVLVNGALVTLGTHLLTGMPLVEVLRNITGGSARRYFLSSYLAFGLLAVLLATVYLQAGDWALLAFAVPLLLARQMFVQWKQLGDASEELIAKQQALLAVTQRMADERRDERLSMVADIHDEVLQPLYKVHLMGQVLRQDLASGRLLDLEEDLPGLLQAAEAANSSIRDLIREMRESPLGSRGLPQTLAMFARSLRAITDASVELDIDQVAGSPLTQLLVYQIAREALSNSARHSGASAIHLSLGVRDGYLRLVVRDDGRGFDPKIERPGHFGVRLMRERAEMAGGVLSVHSDRNTGTIVVAKIPTELPAFDGKG